MKLPTNWRNTDDILRRIINAINTNDDGNISVNSEITLGANQASTTFVDRRLGKDSVILFMPMTANAAAELYGGTMYVTESDYDIADREYTVNHANNAQTDRDFRVVIIGQTL